MQLGEVRVEPAVEAEDDRNRGGTGLLPQRVDAGDVQVDRLLAQDRDAGVDGSADQVDVGRGRRGDDDGVDVAGVEHLGGIGGHPSGAVLLRCRFRPVDEGIADPMKGGLGHRRHTRRVYLADPAGADQSDLQLVTHRRSCRLEALVEVDGAAGAHRLRSSLGDPDGHKPVARRGEVAPGAGGEPDERVGFSAEGALEAVDELVVGRTGWVDVRLGGGHRGAGFETGPERAE